VHGAEHGKIRVRRSKYIDLLVKITCQTAAGFGGASEGLSQIGTSAHGRRLMNTAVLVAGGGKQGEASLVLGAVASARANAEGISGQKASPEWSPTDCQPCVSL
jgi:hypothetical protein